MFNNILKSLLVICQLLYTHSFLISNGENFDSSDLSEILNCTNAGIAIDFNDETSLKSTLLEFYRLYKEKSLQVYSMNIEQYHRRNLTKKISKIIKKI